MIGAQNKTPYEDKRRSELLNEGLVEGRSSERFVGEERIVVSPRVKETLRIVEKVIELPYNAEEDGISEGDFIEFMEVVGMDEEITEEDRRAYTIITEEVIEEIDDLIENDYEHGLIERWSSEFGISRERVRNIVAEAKELYEDNVTASIVHMSVESRLREIRKEQERGVDVDFSQDELETIQKPFFNRAGERVEKPVYQSDDEIGKEDGLEDGVDQPEKVHEPIELSWAQRLVQDSRVGRYLIIGWELIRSTMAVEQTLQNIEEEAKKTMRHGNVINLSTRGGDIDGKSRKGNTEGVPAIPTTGDRGKMNVSMRSASEDTIVKTPQNPKTVAEKISVQSETVNMSFDTMPLSKHFDVKGHEKFLDPTPLLDAIQDMLHNRQIEGGKVDIEVEGVSSIDSRVNFYKQNEELAGRRGHLARNIFEQAIKDAFPHLEVRVVEKNGPPTVELDGEKMTHPEARKKMMEILQANDDEELQEKLREYRSGQGNFTPSQEKAMKQVVDDSRGVKVALTLTTQEAGETTRQVPQGDRIRIIRGAENEDNRMAQTPEPTPPIAATPRVPKPAEISRARHVDKAILEEYDATPVPGPDVTQEPLPRRKGLRNRITEQDIDEVDTLLTRKTYVRRKRVPVEPPEPPEPPPPPPPPPRPSRRSGTWKGSPNILPIKTERYTAHDRETKKIDDIPRVPDGIDNSGRGTNARKSRIASNKIAYNPETGEWEAPDTLEQRGKRGHAVKGQDRQDTARRKSIEEKAARRAKLRRQGRDEA